MQTVVRSVGVMLWDDDNFDWVWQKSQGAAGGLIIMCRTSVFSLLQSFQGDGFIGVRGLWGFNRHEVTVANVYAPCDEGRKHLLWQNILDVMREMGASFGV